MAYRFKCKEKKTLYNSYKKNIVEYLRCLWVKQSSWLHYQKNDP